MNVWNIYILINLAEIHAEYQKYPKINEIFAASRFLGISLSHLCQCIADTNHCARATTSGCACTDSLVTGVPSLSVEGGDFDSSYTGDSKSRMGVIYDDVIKWRRFPRYWPFVRGIHRSPVNSPQKGQWRGAFVFSLICVWINDWVNNREAGDLRRNRAHYDVIVMYRCLFLENNIRLFY